MYRCNHLHYDIWTCVKTLTFNKALTAVDLCRAEQYMMHTHAVIVVCELEAGDAETVVGSHCVFTGTVTTWLSVTLVNI